MCVLLCIDLFVPALFFRVKLCIGADELLEIQYVVDVLLQPDQVADGPADDVDSVQPLAGHGGQQHLLDHVVRIDVVDGLPVWQDHRHIAEPHEPVVIHHHIELLRNVAATVQEYRDRHNRVGLAEFRQQQIVDGHLLEAG